MESPGIFYRKKVALPKPNDTVTGAIRMTHAAQMLVEPYNSCVDNGARRV